METALREVAMSSITATKILSTATQMKLGRDSEINYWVI
jgi:hypothetical protein